MGMLFCEMKFICPKQWENLTLTSDLNIRYCSACNKPVSLVDSPQQIEEAASKSHCVAFYTGAEALLPEALVGKLQRDPHTNALRKVLARRTTLGLPARQKRISFDEDFLSEASVNSKVDNLLTTQIECQDPIDQSILIKAESLRKLGQFIVAAAALDRDFNTDAEPKAEQIMQAIERQDHRPFIFASSRDDGDIEFVWAWKARRYIPDLPQLTGEESFDPPIFHVNNRDWWVKVLGMCSHNWALIEPQRQSGAAVYFLHDMGVSLRPTGFKLGQIKGRSAVVDSLSFESVSHAHIALRANGFERLVLNPGPWFGFEPTGHFYDARSSEEGIYSHLDYWKK